MPRTRASVLAALLACLLTALLGSCGLGSTPVFDPGPTPSAPTTRSPVANLPTFLTMMAQQPTGSPRTPAPILPPTTGPPCSLSAPPLTPRPATPGADPTVTYPPRTGGALAFPGPCVERRYEQPLAFAPDGETLAIGGALTVALHDSHSGAQRWSLPIPARATSIAFTPDGGTLAIGLVDGRIVLCRAADGATLRTLARPERVGGNASFDQDAARPLAFSTDGLLLAAGYASFAALWRLTADVPPIDVPPTLLRGSASGVVALAFTEDGDSLLIAQGSAAAGLQTSPRRLYRWSLAAGAASDSLLLPMLNKERLSGQGPTLAAATDRGVAFWALAPAPAARDAPVLLERRNAPVPGPYSGSTSMQRLVFSPRGDFLVGTTSDSVYLWDVASATSVGSYLVPGQPINGVAIASGGTTVAAVFSDGTVYLWQR